MALSLARDALLSGWRLIRREPLAVLVWWVLRVIEQVSFEAIGSAYSGPSFQAAAMLVVVVFEAFLIAAVFRAQLKPERAGLAWLRFSRIEAKMFAFAAVVGLIALVIAVPVTIALIYTAYFIRWPDGWMVELSIGLAAAVLALLRFAPIPAILVDTGRIDILRSLNATRGRYWSLAIFVLVLGLIERGLGAIWDQVVRLVPGRPTLEVHIETREYTRDSPPPPPEDIHFAWPTPYRVLEVAGYQLIGIALLIFVSAAIVVVWRAAKQTVD